MDRLTHMAKKLLSAQFTFGLLLGMVGTGVAATLKGSSVFGDVQPGSYYDTAVGEMYSLGVIKGNPDGTFRPGDFVTRADVAVMLQRFRDGGNVPDSGTSESS